MARPIAVQLLVICLLSLWGALLTIILFSADKLYSISLIGATLFPIALYASRNPRLFLLVGTVFTACLGLSINFRRIAHIGGAPSFSVDLMDLFLLPLIIFLVRDFSVGYRRGFRFSSVSVWWLGMIALGVWSIIQGPHRQFPAFEVVRMLKCWLLFLVIINECVREKHFHYIVMALVGGVAINVLAAFIQYVLKHDLGLQALGEPSPEATLGASYGVYLSFGSTYRVGALIGHPNLFAAYLALLLPIFIGLIYTQYSLKNKLLFGAVSATGALALLFTLSRSGWASFALALICLSAVIIVHPALRSRYARIKGVMFGGIAIGALAAAGPIIKRITASDAGATNFRSEWVEIAWRMIQDKPIVGFGLNTFSYNIIGYAKYDVSTIIDLFGNVWPVVHNIYMLTWSEQGTIGLLLFLGLHANIILIGAKNLRRVVSDKVFMINIGAVSGIVAIMLDGFASFFIRVPAPGRVFWIVVGLIVAARYWNQRNEALRLRSTDEHYRRQSDSGAYPNAVASLPGNG